MHAIDMQVHTNYSYDGYVPLDELDRACSRRMITTVAITDHDEITGGLEASRLYGMARFKTRVIVGEEVSTTQGEIIGLFLKERIPPGMSMASTIDAIRDQGGVVYLNHPFGYGQRSSRLVIKDLDGLWDKIDIVEIFNGRNRTQEANDRAKELALKYGKPGGVGSDAHSSWEVGRSYVCVETFDGPKELVLALRKARYVCRPCPFVYRVLFKARKLLAPRPVPHSA